jgi:hypothetical protein
MKLSTQTQFHSTHILVNDFTAVPWGMVRRDTLEPCLLMATTLSPPSLVIFPVFTTAGITSSLQTQFSHARTVDVPYSTQELKKQQIVFEPTVEIRQHDEE